jgi:hypothetical protein
MTLELTGSGGVTFNQSNRFFEVPNALDAYEEGRWTGSLRMSSGTGVTDEDAGWNTTLDATGTYTKIGKCCQISIYFDVTAYSNFTALKVDNLPFVAGDQAEAFSGAGGYPISIGHCRGTRFNYNGTIITSANLTASVARLTRKISLRASSRTSAFTGWWYISNEPAQGKYIHLGGVYQTAN